MSSLGEAIVMARLAAGKTQEDLASEAGLKQGPLSRYENNLRHPDQQTLAAIAQALNVTPTFLEHCAGMRGAMAVDAHMRRRATAKPTIWKRLEARLNLLRCHSAIILEDVRMHAPQAMPAFDPFEVTPEDAARMTRMQWRMPIGPVVNLVGWLESAGCIVFEEDFGTTRVDGLSQWIGAHPVVLLNAKSPTDRKRLTTGHELGHLVLHADDMGDDPEAEANRFSAEFLMPAEVIKPQLRNLTIGRLHELKRYWGVSMQAIIERAYHLKCITQTQRTSFYKQFSARGWRTSEPLSDSLTPEHPRLVADITEAMVARGLTPEEISHVAGFDRPAPENPFAPPAARLRLA